MVVVDAAENTSTVSMIGLTKEYALLWLLSNHPDQVFTREQLLNQIWDADYYGSASVVTSLVKRLREKIEPDVSNPYYIRTIHGAGYKLGVKPC